MKKKLILFLVLVLLLFGMLTGSAEAAVTYSFDCISEDADPENAAIGESQFFVEVEDFDPDDPDSDQVFFTFTNTGDYECYIAGVYFYDGVLLEIAQIYDYSSEVSFIENAEPLKPNDELPGAASGSKLVYGLTILESADAGNPSPTWGINPGEYLTILFNLTGDSTYEDVIVGLNENTIVIGVKGQGFPFGGNNDSASFINNGVIPAPGAVVLGSIGVTLVGCLRRKRTL